MAILRRTCWLRHGACAVLLIALAPALPAFARFQGPADPSPATGIARVMAQGVVDLTDTQLVWLVASEIANPPANAAEANAATGFLIAGNGAIIVEDLASGDQTRLAGGEAMLTRDGEQELRAALGATAASYFAMELHPAQQQVEKPDGGYLGSAFAGPGGRHDLDLVGVELAAGQSINIPAGVGPTLVLVTTGSAEVATDKAEYIPLATGEAHSVSGPVTVTGYDGGAAVAIAVIGPAVPRLVAIAPPAADGGDAAAEPGDKEQSEAPPPAGTPELANPAERRKDRTSTPVTGSSVDPNDPDGDGLTNAEEDDLNTDPGLSDTDGDGLNDGREVKEFGTLPLAADTDGDGVNDFDEFADQLMAAGETPPAGGSGQSGASRNPVMVDQVPPAAQAPQGQPGQPAAQSGGGEGDSDGDGLSDGMEYEIGTDPFNPDSDSDNATDGQEWNLGLTGPLNPDDDRDGKLDGDEINAGTDPNDPSQ